MSRVMKRLTAIIFVLCLIFGCVGLAPRIADTEGVSVAKAAVKKYVRFVKPATLKVHKKASASSRVVITLKKDNMVTQYGSSNSGGWVKIRYASGKYGYVRKTDLKRQISKAGLKAATKKIKNKVINVAESYGWKFESATDIDLYKFDGGGTMASLWIKLSNSKFVLKTYLTVMNDCLDCEYSTRIYVTGYERKRYTNHNYDMLVSYLKKYAV